MSIGIMASANYGVTTAVGASIAPYECGYGYKCWCVCDMNVGMCVGVYVICM